MALLPLYIDADVVVPVVPPTQYGDSPMHYACFCGHGEAVLTLLEAGADPNKVLSSFPCDYLRAASYPVVSHRRVQSSKDGKTPIESAKEEGHEAVVQMLLSAIAVRV